MLTTITNLGKELEVKEKEIQRLQTKLSKLDPDNEARQPEKKAAAKKATAKKASAKPKEAAKAEEKKDTQKLADPKAE
jgi:alpha-amylase